MKKKDLFRDLPPESSLYGPPKSLPSKTDLSVPLISVPRYDTSQFRD